MNYARIVLGGLFAGLMSTLCEFIVNDFLLNVHMTRMFRRFNLTPPAGSFIAIALTLTFALVILLVWLYAMIRPRYGPGPKTPICAALVIWFVVGVYVNIIYGVMFGLGTTMIAIGMVWGLVQYCLATIAGAWVYKEA